jgi:hypothetical protein
MGVARLTRPDRWRFCDSCYIELVRGMSKQCHEWTYLELFREMPIEVHKMDSFEEREQFINWQ